MNLRIFRVPPTRIVALMLVPAWLCGVRLAEEGVRRIPPVISLERATSGLLTAEFLLGALALIGVILLVRGIGGTRLPDAGLDGDYIAGGVGMAALLWGAAQVLAVLPRVVAQQAIVPDPELVHAPVREVGRLLSQVAFAAADGVGFRGFLLTQLYLRFHPKDDRRRMTGLGSALMLSQVLAVAVLLPSNMATSPYLDARAAIQGIGLLLGTALLVSWVFVQTGNLFFSIGVHALLLAPLPLMAEARWLPDWVPSLAVAVLAVVWGLLWVRKD